MLSCVNLKLKLLEKFIEEELNLDSSKFMTGFILYDKLLLEWNQKVNLISRKSVSTEEHVLNSIYFLKRYNFSKVKTIVDIGTGGGFPGIPLKIIFPETEVLFIDSIKKKMVALEDIVKNMNLKNVKIECGRAEEFAENKIYRRKYDIVISKAVAPLENLYQWGRSFMAVKGEMLCLKGGDINEELNALNKLKYKFYVKVNKFEFADEYKIEDKKLVIIS